MAAFTELDPDVIRKALEGQESVLDSLVAKEEAFLRNVKCPVCGSGEHSRRVNQLTPFTDGNPLPNLILNCLTCESEFDPYSLLVRRVNDGSI